MAYSSRGSMWSGSTRMAPLTAHPAGLSRWKVSSGICPTATRCTVAAPTVVMRMKAVVSTRLFSLADLGVLLEGIGLGHDQVLPFTAYLCVSNGVLEELYWRRLASLEGHEIPIGDALYALFHLPIVAVYMPWVLVLPALVAMWVAGFVWRASIRALGSTVPAMLSHVACNVAIWMWLYRL